jgi:hypothetical protein
VRELRDDERLLVIIRRCRISAFSDVQWDFATDGVTELIGSGHIYPTDERVGATLKRAYTDAQGWIRDQPAEGACER